MLQGMGMKQAFGEEADFSKMTTKKGLLFSRVTHKTYIHVNEEGTKAAAVTFGDRPFGGPRRNQPKIFTADHPFLFLIRHEKTGAILFMGRVMNPKP